MTGLQHFFMYTLQEVALATMAIVYLLRLVWVFARFRPAAERQPRSGDHPQGETRGALYSLGLVARPSHLATATGHSVLYAQFALFHLGIAAAITLSFALPYAPSMAKSSLFAWIDGGLIALGAGAALLRLVRRFRDNTVRAMSSPDDYFSLMLLFVWLVLALLMLVSGGSGGSRFATPFFAVTAFFLFYVPFSKISHYLYYPLTRYWLGRSLGRRGVYPLPSRSASTAVQEKRSAR